MSSRRNSTLSRERSEWARPRRRERPSRGREPRRSRCMMAQDAQADLKESVLRALSTVTDPELDEPITELGFVKNLSVSEDGRVSVDLVKIGRASCRERGWIAGCDGAYKESER